MTAMLNTLLDINQIEVGAVKVEPVEFPVSDILDRLRGELAYHAQSAGLALKVMPLPTFHPERPASARADGPQSAIERPQIHSTRPRAESAAGAVTGKLRIQIWDTGVGHPDLRARRRSSRNIIRFDNPARQRSRGLGLGLSIVKSLGDLSGSSDSGCARCQERARYFRSRSRWLQGDGGEPSPSHSRSKLSPGTGQSDAFRRQF